MAKQNTVEQNELGKIRIGISSCLLGQPVRYDGGHKRDRFLTDVFSRFVEYVPVCPEVECGLPVPRESMRLIGDPEQPRLVAPKSGVDHSRRMREWAARRVEELAAENLCGFVFKSNSPSSGLFRVKVYNQSGMAAKVGVGLFARAVVERFPDLPVEEEGRLHDAGLRENFIERVFAFSRWRDLVLGVSRPAPALVEFHARHKLSLMAHRVSAVSALGRLVAQAGERPFGELAQVYVKQFMEALGKVPTPARHTNAMMHALGYFKLDLSADEKREALELIEQYRHGHLPLIVPLTLLHHYARKYRVEYLLRQHYLRPGPPELHLRNHA